MATTTLRENDLFSIAQIGSDEYFIEGATYGTKWNDETGSSVAPDIEDYVQEEEEQVDYSSTEYILDDLGNFGWKMIGGRPKKARRR